MFIERSAGRIRLTRLIFVVAGLLPCVLLTGWAVHRGSVAHRDAVRVGWQAAIGLQLEVAAIANYQGTLEKFLSETRTALKTVYVETRQSATRWTEEQLKAAEEINRRTTAISAPASTGSAPAPASSGS